MGVPWDLCIHAVAAQKDKFLVVWGQRAELEREPEWVDPEDDLWCLGKVVVFRRGWPWAQGCLMFSPITWLSGDCDLVRLFLRTAREEGLERLLFLSLSGDDEELE